jgi:hypothetical protein
MKAIVIFALASFSIFALHPASARASDRVFRVPAGLSATRDVRTAESARTALSKYVEFCTARDDATYSQAFTRDAVIEYPEEIEGQYKAQDILLSECWSLVAHFSDTPRVGSVWIFPSGRADTVFVQYGRGSSAGAGVALVQMRDELIQRIRVLSPD